jgi:hypothetical protein
VSWAATFRRRARQGCVGMEINANHLRPVTSGWVIGTARPIAWAVAVRSGKSASSTTTTGSCASHGHVGVIEAPDQRAACTCSLGEPGSWSRARRVTLAVRSGRLMDPDMRIGRVAAGWHTRGDHLGDSSRPHGVPPFSTSMEPSAPAPDTRIPDLHLCAGQVPREHCGRSRAPRQKSVAFSAAQYRTKSVTEPALHGSGPTLTEPIVPLVLRVRAEAPCAISHPARSAAPPGSQAERGAAGLGVP